MELDETGDLGQLGVAAQPHLLEGLFGASLDAESVHGNEHHPSPGPGQNVAVRFCGVLAVRGKHVAEIMIEEGLAPGRDRSLRNRPYDRHQKRDTKK
jgi:hypothetical protein